MRADHFCAVISADEVVGKAASRVAGGSFAEKNFSCFCVAENHAVADLCSVWVRCVLKALENFKSGIGWVKVTDVHCVAMSHTRCVEEFSVVVNNC